MMLLRLLTMIVPFLLLHPICSAQTLEKNGFPCVSEICLGDDIAELSKVKWDRSKNPFSSPAKPLYTSSRRVSIGEMKTLEGLFRGDLKQAAPFLADQLFDSTALTALAKVSAACGTNELFGTYTSEGGNPTRVGISLMADQTDTSHQRWRVTSIFRSFPSAISSQQQSEAEAQLSEKYRAFDIRKTKNAAPGEGRFSMSMIGSFGFHLHIFKGIDEANRLKLHPACGGQSKVNLN